MIGEAYAVSPKVFKPVSDRSPLQRGFIRETTLFGILLLASVCLIPPAVYLVGNMVFGQYSEGGFSTFALNMIAALANGSRPIWFLMLAPYLVVQSLRLAIWGVRRRTVVNASH